MKPGPAFPSAPVRHPPRDFGGKLLLQAGSLVKDQAKVHPENQTVLPLASVHSPLTSVRSDAS